MSHFSQFERHLRDFLRGGSTGEFERLALELFALQFAHNSPYRKLCAAEGRTPERVTDWKEMPAVPAAAFKELELTSIPVAERTEVFCSSGTTGQSPSRHFHNAASLSVYEASVQAWAQQHLPSAVGSLVFLTPPRLAVPHSSLVHMFDTLQRHHGRAHSTFLGTVDGEGSWHVNTARALTLLSIVEASGEPVGLLGTAFNFVHLLDALSEAGVGLRLPRGSWVLETGGYKGRSRSMPRPQLHASICGTLGIDSTRIVSEYGMSELSSQAYDRSLTGARETDGILRFPPWARVRIVSPENGRDVPEGEIGLIRVYDLANVYSVMAIETEDLGVRRGEGFQLVGRAERAEARGCSLMSV